MIGEVQWIIIEIDFAQFDKCLVPYRHSNDQSLYCIVPYRYREGFTVYRLAKYRTVRLITFSSEILLQSLRNAEQPDSLLEIFVAQF